MTAREVEAEGGDLVCGVGRVVAVLSTSVCACGVIRHLGRSRRRGQNVQRVAAFCLGVGELLLQPIRSSRRLPPKGVKCERTKVRSFGGG